MRTPYMILALLYVSLGILGCEPSQNHLAHKVVIPPPTQSDDSASQDTTYDYQHKIQKSTRPKRSFDGDRVLKRKIAVARFRELGQPLASPFRTQRRGMVNVEENLSVEASDGKLKLQQKDSAQIGYQMEPCPAFTGLLVNKLTESGRFIVIERKEIDNLLLEQDFTLSGRALPPNAAEMGKVFGAEYIITGEVADVEATSGQDEKKQTQAFVRIYDAETSEIIASAGIKADTAQQAVAQAAESVIASVKDKPWRVKLSAVRAGDIVILNAGLEAGIDEYDRFEIISLGPEIRDPDEGTFLGYEKSHLAVVEVFEVHPKYAKAKMLIKIVPGQFKTGDLAEYIPGPYGEDATDYLERLRSPEFEDEK